MAALSVNGLKSQERVAHGGGYSHIDEVQMMLTGPSTVKTMPIVLDLRKPMMYCSSVAGSSPSELGTLIQSFMYK